MRVDIRLGVLERRTVLNSVTEGLVIDLSGVVKIKKLLELLTNGEMAAVILAPNRENIFTSTSRNCDANNIRDTEKLTNASKAEFLPESVNKSVAFADANDPAATPREGLPSRGSTITNEVQRALTRIRVGIGNVRIVAPEILKSIKRAELLQRLLVLSIVSQVRLTIIIPESPFGLELGGE